MNIHKASRGAVRSQAVRLELSAQYLMVFVIMVLVVTGCGVDQPAPAPTLASGQDLPLPTLPFPESGSIDETPEATNAPAETNDGGRLVDGLFYHEGWARIPFIHTVFGGYGADQINDVVSGGPGVVAVGFEARGNDINGAVWYSVDGVNWSRVFDSVDLGGIGVQSISSVASGPAGIVAVGLEKIADDENAAVWFSEDGVTWTRVRASDSVFGDANSQVMSDVVSIGNGFIAVGTEKTEDQIKGAVWLSSDGLTWERNSQFEDTLDVAAEYTTVKSLLANGSTLIAVGWREIRGEGNADGVVWISSNAGQTWSRMSGSEQGLGDTETVRFQQVYAIAQTDDGYVLGATEQNPAGSISGDYVNALIWASDDGVSWGRVFDHKPDHYQQSLLDIIATGFGFFAAGYEILGEQAQAAIWFSEDGLIWNQTPPSEVVFGGPGIQRINSLAEAGPGVVAVGYTTENGDQDAAIWIYDEGVRKSE